MMQFFRRMWPTIFLTVFCVTMMDSSVYAINSIESNDVNMNYLSTNINWIVDKFLHEFSKITVKTGKSEVKLEDLNITFEQKLFVVDVFGSFQAKDGSLKNVSTIYRTGDATISEIGGKVIVSVYLGLREVNIFIRKYMLNFLNIHQYGIINATVGENSIRLELTIAHKPKCSVTLTDLQVEVLKNIEVDVTGLSMFDHWISDITSWIINATENRYKPNLEKFLFTEISKAVVDADICHYLPF